MSTWVAFVAVFAAGLLVGVNPFVAPSLRARLTERERPMLVWLEASAVAAAVLITIAAFAFEFASFVSGRLRNMLLLLGVFTVVGGAYAWRPVGRKRDADPAVVGRRWWTRFGADVLYYGAPAWLVGLVVAMSQVTALRFSVAFMVTFAGLATAFALWTLPGSPLARHLPAHAPRPGEASSRVVRRLAIAYASAGALMLAAGVGFF